MTREEIAAMIAGMGLPYAYDHFAEADGEHPQGPPFICFLYPTRVDFVADDSNYQPITQLVVELYTDNVDFSLEDTVESVLSQYGLPYAKDREYIDGERMYQTTYTTTVPLQPSPEPDPQSDPEPGPDPEPDPDGDDGGDD